MALTPSATFFHAIERHTKTMGLSFSGKLPYRFDHPQLGPCRLRLSFRLYPPQILAVSARVTAETGQSDPAMRSLLPARTLPSELRELIGIAAGIVNSGDHRSPTSGLPIRTRVGFHLYPVGRGSDMPAFVARNLQDLVGLLIGSPPDTLDGALVERIAGQNRELNLKNARESFVANKQGVVLLSPHDERPDANTGANRLWRAMDLVELALVYGTFLDRYPFSRPTQEDFADYVFSRIDAWLVHPEVVFHRSYGNRLLWDCVSDSSQLTSTLKMIKSQHAYAKEAVANKQEFFAQISDRWWKSPDFAAGFDASAFARSRILVRIKDTPLRLSILEDLREAEASLRGKNIKAAVVMAGAAVEAMLLGLLQEETNEPGLAGAALAEYIKLVRKHSLVRDAAMLDLLDSSLRQWRNYVHPGKAQREQVNLTLEHAEIVVTAARALAGSI
jgi:hypothetical protein